MGSSSIPLSAFAARVASAAAMLNDPSLIEAAALMVESGAKEQISGPLRAVKTGTLRRDINHKVNSATAAVVGNNVGYAEHVHDGTKVMEGRPYLTAAKEEALSSGNIEDLLEKFAGTLLAKFLGG